MGIVPAERRILLLSRAARLEPVLRQIAAERSLRFVRAPDARSAYERLTSDRFACALIDLDALGDGAAEFLSRVRGMRPELHAVGFGSASRGVTPVQGYPLLPKPLSHDDLVRALDDAGPAATPRRAGSCGGGSGSSRPCTRSAARSASPATGARHSITS